MLPASPSLTIVVASTGQRQPLLADLAAAAPQCVRDEVELIVARADTPAGLVELATAFPQTRFIGAPPATDLAELRSLGFAGAKGDVVALMNHTDDHGPAHDRWLSELRRRCSLHRCRRTSTETAAEVGAMLPHPLLSVVVPVHQGADVLPQSLTALTRSDLPRQRWELIVVDDASTDETARIAARFADVVVRLPGKPHGTAYARNRGFEFTRGECVAFIDADVAVHPDTLARFALVLAREPQVSAVFGTFDSCPGAAGLVAKYRTLRLRYYHQENAGIAETFRASCGALRSTVFASVGMFDEWHFPRHGVEDFELGHRLRQDGHRIVMRPDIQAAHLKCWTLRETIAADLRDRVVPWMRLFDRRAVARTRRKDRLRTVKQVNTALTWLALVLTLAWLRADWPPLLLTAGMCTAVVLRNLLPQHRFFMRHSGHAFALAAVPLELLSYLVNGVAVVVGWLSRQLLGEPKPHPRVEAFAEMGVRTWPPVPSRRADPIQQPPPATLGRSA
ncbi:MAG: glycosyltransferase family 2 protein [Gemmatimonadota bacterium]|nr:glycosyltransferase family 2 protein [Gemmatimonadota bacterium]